MGDLERIEAKVDWMVDALKYLLTQQIEDNELDLETAKWFVEKTLDDYSVEEDMSQFEHVAVRTRPAPKAKPCPHNQQVVIDGILKCGRCGFPLMATGVAQSTVGADGRVIPDPNPPGWATEHSPGASSKNPGGPLVPHSV